MLGQAIGDLLPLAVTIAISPIPLVAVILMLFSQRARVNSWLFLLGWIVGVVGATVALVVVANTQDLTQDNGQPTDSVSTVTLLLGVALVVLAFRRWRLRPGKDETPELPKYLEAVDAITPPKAFGLAVLLSAVNPKNLLLIVAAAITIAQADLSDADAVAAVAMFAAIACASVTTIVVFYQLTGTRGQPALDAVRAWLTANNSAIMAVMLLVIGVVVIGKAIAPIID